MVEKGSKNRIFVSVHVQLASDAAAFAPTINFDVSGSKPLIVPPFLSLSQLCVDHSSCHLTDIQSYFGLVSDQVLL
jgi:hypothetical protein